MPIGPATPSRVFLTPRRLDRLCWKKYSPRARPWGKLHYRMELEPAGTEFQPVEDGRPKLPPVPPVQLVAVADVLLPALAGLERELDAFYVGLLRMGRDEKFDQDDTLVYRAQNVRLCLAIQELPPLRQDFRATGAVVPSLADLSQRLTEAEIDFLHQRGLVAGSDSVMLMDPAGNFVQVFESRELG